MIKRICAITPFVFLLTAGFAQNASKPVVSSADEIRQDNDESPTVPIRTLDFKAVESPANFPASSIMAFPTECTSDGSLFLDMLDPQDLNQHTVVSIQGKNTKTYPASAITDLHDISVTSVYPSENTVGFLVRASKETPGPHVPGKSSAGISWKDYHNFIAEFDRNGQYKKSIQLPVDYTLSHFAILSSGEYLITGYDKVNSTVRLLFVKPSGELLRSLDMPPARDFASKNEDNDLSQSDKVGRQLLGSIVLTRYKNDILVWRMNSSLPVLDVGPGAAVREVPIQSHPGQVFVDMLPATNRWIAHFRSETAPENGAYNQKNYFYYELNSEDGSISTRLLESGDAPNSISCETSGKFIGLKKDDNNKLIILVAE